MARRDRMPRPLPAADVAMFLDATRGAVPLAGGARLPVPPPPPRPELPGAVTPPPRPITVEGTGERLALRAPGVSRAQLAELARGGLRVEDTLDLHGVTVDACAAALARFLAGAERARHRCVLVVHGWGRDQGGTAPLRDEVVRLLAGPLSGWVRAAAAALPKDGGLGATYVKVGA